MNIKIKFWLLIICLIFFSLFSSSNKLFAMAKKVKKNKYNLLLITIDTLRADHLGCYGYMQVKTPNIDKLAFEGVIFTKAVTPVPITLPAHTSIMTGQYPIQHGVRNNGNFVLGQEATTLAEIMSDNGFETGACIGAFVLESLFGLDQGFSFYDDKLPARRKHVSDILYTERVAEDISNIALKWLKEKREDQFFLWLHYFDPHSSYSPPFPFSNEYKSHPYDGEIAYTDKALGDLFQGMENMGILGNTIIILTADHGEGLGEHNEETHAIFIYEATLNVPLIIYGPEGFFPKNRSIPAMVSNMDIFPTVLELFNIKKPSNIAAKSLIPLIFNKKDQIHSEILIECLCPELNFGWSGLFGVRSDNWKYIEAPKSEIYNLKEDPYELVNLIDKGINEHMKWQNKLDKLKGLYQKKDTAGKTAKMSAQLQDKLRSLGYVWTTTKKEESKIKRDPKDMIYLMNDLNQGVRYLDSYYIDPAIECFKKVIAVNPDNDAAHYHLGMAYQKKELLDLAEAEFKYVLNLNPSYLDIHNQLGLVYYLMGKYDESLQEFKLALAFTEYPEVYYNISLVYDKKGQPEQAIAEVEKALSYDPNYVDALNHAGNIYLSEGDLKRAAAHFERSIKIDILNSSAYNNLGLIYSRQGKPDLALRYFNKTIAFDPKNPEAHNNLGGIYLSQRLYEKAKQECKKALEYRPDYKKALINLGLSHFYLKEYIEAKRAFNRVIELDGEYPEAYNQLGLLYLSTGEFSMSLYCFEKMLLLNPKDPMAYYNLGKVKQALGKIDQAILDWKTAISLTSELPAAHLNLGNAYFEKNLLNKAIAEWEMALEGRGVTVFSHLLNLGMVYSQMGKYDFAIKAWQEAKEFNIDDPNLYYYLGVAYFNQGLYDLAYNEIKDTIRLQPDNEQAHLLLEKIKGIMVNEP